MNVPRTIGIYLAAGNSTRMGTDKRALPFAHYSLGSTALQAAVFSFLSSILIIVPASDPLDWIAPELLRHEKCTVIRCHSSANQGCSLRCGIHEAIRRQSEAAVVLLADQPFVRCETINELITCYDQTRTDYVAFVEKGVPLPPILFSATVFSPLLEIHGDKGARQLLRQQHWNGTLLSTCDANLFFDIDTNEDYEQAIKRWKQGGKP